MSETSHPAHFKGKNALDHVIEAQAQGVIASAEIHGLETPGYLSAACDAARESALFLSLLALLFSLFPIAHAQALPILIIFSCSWMLWKAGRAGWLGWFRLERLHRILEQERWEIEHHRQQERDELRELYAAKGFEGKLLEDVLDVLMADNERLLKVMVEEELGLSLTSVEHPLKQALGAAAGVFFAALLCLLLFVAWPPYGLFLGAFFTVAIAAGLAAHLAQNLMTPAIIWNLGIGILAFGCAYFLLHVLI